MEGFEISDIIQLLILLATVSVALLTIWNSTKNMREQSRAQFYADLTRRYQELTLAMPQEVLHYARRDSETYKKACVKRYMRLYFNLCSEEYYLYKKGLISKEVWELWREGIIENMKQYTYQKSWELLHRVAYEASFRDLIFELEKEAKRRQPPRERTISQST